MSHPWWHDLVLYQIYPRSFQDSNGDGIGDLHGIASRLDHLQWLGVNGIWLSPTMPSPNHDWGYDVTDYRGVHPDLGTQEDLDRLLAEARARGIAVLLDLVPNHTSDEHPWFQEAGASRSSRRRDWYVWGDPKPDGGPPNNWIDATGGSAWTQDERSGQYYLHNFLPEQPDLNWWNAEVRDEFDRILRHWFDRGVAGFRVDVANAIVKDRLLRDEPPAGATSAPGEQRAGLRHVYSRNRPEVHEVHARWRRLCDSYEPARVLVGETVVTEIGTWASFYGRRNDGLHLVFDFPLLLSPFRLEEIARVVEGSLQSLPNGGWADWVASNHDNSRFPTRWADGDEQRARLILLLLLTLRGSPTLYYGDEIALQDVPIPPSEAKDGFVLPGGTHPGRDPERTPMPWEAGPGHGFTAPDAVPWLPFGNDGNYVADQRRDPGSPLHLTRDLIALRRSLADLRRGGQHTLHRDRATWAYRRGDRTTVALNLAPEPRAVPGVAGRIELSTLREREGSLVRDRLELRPQEGVIIVSD